MTRSAPDRTRRARAPAWAWLVLLASAIGLAPQALAAPVQACSAQVLASLAKAYKVDALRGAADAVIAQTCKAWPYDTAITLAAVAYSQSAAETIPGERRLGLVVAMLSSADSRVLSGVTSTVEEDALTSLNESSLRLETARYDLAPGQRAFGVVVDSDARGPSCPDRGFNRELTLYVRDGARLRPVLATYLDTWAVVEGNACGGDAANVTEHARTRIGVEQTRSHGFADLSITANVTRDRYDPAAPNPADIGDPDHPDRAAKRVLRYDGSRYSLDAFDDLFFWQMPPRSAHE